MELKDVDDIYFLQSEHSATVDGASMFHRKAKFAFQFVKKRGITS
jgi:hypothetical protein